MIAVLLCFQGVWFGRRITGLS